MRLIKTMDVSSNQGRVCQLRLSNSPAIARIGNAASAQKTRCYVAHRVKHGTSCADTNSSISAVCSSKTRIQPRVPTLHGVGKTGAASAACNWRTVLTRVFPSNAIRIFRYNAPAVIFVGERFRNREAAEGALPIIAQAKEPQKSNPALWRDLRIGS